MSDVVGVATVLILPDTTGFKEKVEADTGTAFGGVSKNAEKAGEDAGTKLAKGFEKGAKYLTLGAVGLAAGMVDLAAKQQKVTTSIANAEGISVKAAERISAAFLNTGGSAEFSGRAIGEAYSKVAGELGTVAGHALSAGEASKVMAASMNLAEATGKELGSTTEALGGIMLAYHLNAGQAAGASDILYNTSRRTGTSIEQLATQLEKMRGRLGVLAPSLAESGGLMEVLASHGISGRQSLTALNGAFSTLLGGTKAVNEASEQLGLHIFNQNHQFVGLKDVITQLQPKLAGMNQEQQLAATKALFGASANKQLLSVILEGPKAYSAATLAVQKHGAAAEAAKRQGETFEGELKKLRAAAEDLGTKIGLVLIPVLTKLGHGLLEGVEWLKKHEAAAKALAVVITTVLGAAIGSFVAVRVASFITGTKQMIDAIVQVGTKMLATAGVMGTAEATMVEGADATAASVDAALIGTGIGAAVVALGIAAYELATHWEEAMQLLEKAAAAAANFVIGQINKMIEATNELVEVLTLGLAPAIGKIGEVHTGAEEEREANEGPLTKQEQKELAKLNKGVGEERKLRGGNGGPVAAGQPGSATRGMSKGELEQLWVEAGGPKSQAGTAANIALAESGGRSIPNSAGSGAEGIWQIKGSDVPGNLDNPLVNAKNAVAKYEAAHGFTPWESYDKNKSLAAAPGTGASGGFKTSEETKAAEKAAKAQEEAASKQGKEATKIAKELAEIHKKATAEQVKLVEKDTKEGTTELNKLSAAIQKGGMHELAAQVGGVHEREFTTLIGRLDKEHTSGMDKLVKELKTVHATALEALSKALVKVAEEAALKKQKFEDKIVSSQADAQVSRIQDETKLAIDKEEEGGLSGSALATAQAQTYLDAVKREEDAIIEQRKVEAAKAGRPETEAIAAHHLTEAESIAKVNEAKAQAALELTTEAGKVAEAREKTEKERLKVEEERLAVEKTSTVAAAGPALPNFEVVINGANMTGAQIVQELGFQIKAGGLPLATVTP